jgi:hypothetical protein
VRAGRVSVVGVLSVCRKLWSWRWFSEEVVSKQVGSTWTTAGTIAAFSSHSQQPIACICRSAKTEPCLLLLQDIIFILCVAGRGGSVVQFALQLSMLKTSTLLGYLPPIQVQANITVQSRKRNYGSSNSLRYVPDSGS